MKTCGSGQSGTRSTWLVSVLHQAVNTYLTELWRVKRSTGICQLYCFGGKTEPCFTFKWITSEISGHLKVCSKSDRWTAFIEGWEHGHSSLIFFLLILYFRAYFLPLLSSQGSASFVIQIFKTLKKMSILASNIKFFSLYHFDLPSFGQIELL